MTIPADQCSCVIRVADVDFCVCQRGVNPQVVFLHGFGADLRTWDDLWLAMDSRTALLRYDLRGFGQSVVRREGVFSHSDDLLSLMDAMGIASADLVGVSMGGGIALNFALDHPERVRNLVLISPAVVAWDWSDEWRALWRPIVALAREGAMNEARHLWWQHPVFTSTRHSAGKQALYDSIMRYSGDQWMRDDQRPALPDVDRIHLLKARTLLLTGGQDMADFSLIADLLEATAQKIQRVEFAALGHLLHLEDPAGCARAIESFFESEIRSRR